MTNRRRWTYSGAPEATEARAAVAGTVRELVFARQTQVVVEALCLTGFAAGLLAIVVVLALRLGGRADLVGFALIAIALGAVLAAALLARARRPAALETVVIADLRLRMKQRLSSAAEFLLEGGDATDVDRLTGQAVRARLPRQSHRAFPLHLTTFGWLLPPLAVGLLLVSWVDMPEQAVTAPRASHRAIAEEGRRLEAFALGMANRARRDGLEHSAREARGLEQLATRMRSGALALGESLERLRSLDRKLSEARERALESGQRTAAGPIAVDDLGRAARQAARLSEAIRRLRLDPLDRSSREALRRELRAGTGRGANGESRALEAALERALDALSEGDREALDRLLDELMDEARNSRDGAELERARAEIRRSRQTLGDEVEADGSGGSGGERTRRIRGGDGAGEEAGLAGLDADSGTGDVPGEGAGGGMHADGANAGEQGASKSMRPGAGVLIEPDSRFGEGPVFTGQARVEPRANDALQPLGERIARRYRQQAESVLSRESFPVHERETVRRYFIRLSEPLSPSNPSER